jgi:hypothetical protein
MHKAGTKVLITMGLMGLFVLMVMTYAWSLPVLGPPSQQNQSVCLSCHGPGTVPGPSPAAPASTPVSSPATTNVGGGTGTYTIQSDIGSIRVDGRTFNGKLYLPLRQVGNQFGAYIEWNNTTKTATMNKVDFKIGTNARLINVRTYAQVDGIFNALNMTPVIDGFTIIATPKLPSSVPATLVPTTPTSGTCYARCHAAIGI